MTKSQFLDLLKEKLAFLPEYDLEDQLYFYSEMIDDRINDGLSQEDAISEIGSIEDIVAQKCIKRKCKSRYIYRKNCK